MSTYLISYSLANPTANKHVLANAIMASGRSWARPLDHTWYVKSEQQVEFLEAFLSATLDDGDSLVVQAVREDAAMANTSLRWFKHRPQDDAASHPNETREDAAVIPHPATFASQSPDLQSALAAVA